jgi:flagellar biosynthesis protein FlhA
MIRAFASFVVGSGGTDGLVVGFIIFIIIIAVQVVVITKGATRVSEVAARFTLDSMNVKMMAIETELSSGAITEEESQAKKKELQQEMDFYGAMDGASKFISGNVKVGIFITVINILGGIIIGVVLHGEPPINAVGNYISFSIGDGLLSQFPALLVSIAMGIVVTRAAAPGNLGQQVEEQFSRDEKIYWIGAGVLVFFALLPGFPWYVLLPMAALVAFYAFVLYRRKRRKMDFAGMMTRTADKDKKPREEGAEISKRVPLDDLSLELGYGLIPLVDKNSGAELLERVRKIRREAALELGLVIPNVRIQDNMFLEPSEYCIKLKGVEAGRGKIRMNHYLCINPGTATTEIAGEKTREPTFGLPAVWITEDRLDEAERAGYTVVDPASIIATHFAEIIRHHAWEILGRQDTQDILDSLRDHYHAVVDDVLKAASLGEIQKVFQGLLKERVSIRNTVTILEAIADYAPVSHNIRFLTERARQALASQISHQYADEERRLRVLTIDPELEQQIIDSQMQTPGGDFIAAMKPELRRDWLAALTRAVMAVKKQGWVPVILCSEAARYLVRHSTDREIPELVVLSVNEIARDMMVESVGVIKPELQPA